MAWMWIKIVSCTIITLVAAIGRTEARDGLNLATIAHFPLLSQLSEPTSSDLTFPVQEIRVLGNTVLTEEIKSLIKRYENRELTFERLLELRSQITQLYIENGYVSSGAFLLENSDLSRGIIEIQVVEGELEEITIEGLSRLRQSYVRSRIEIGANTPLNEKSLQDALALLLLDPLIARINAELTVGSAPGRNILLVEVEEAPAFKLGIGIDNYRPPSVGSWQGKIDIAHNNLLGFGDRISGSYGITEGLNIYDVSYTIPFNARNGTLSIFYGNNDSSIVDNDFQRFGIRGNAETISFSLRQPVVRSPFREIALGFTLDLRDNRTFIENDIPFSFADGSLDGRSQVTVMRFFQDWIDRRNTRILAARSQFSFGLDANGATVSETEPDGLFLAWLGQFQAVQQLNSRNLLITRFNAQLTPDSLLNLEGYSLGGINNVRGYRQNQVIADNGLFGSIEFQLPLTSDPQIFAIAPFFDFGTVWNSSENVNNNSGNDSNALAGLGVGARWQINEDLFFSFDYAIPLIAVDRDGNSLQENGLYFSIFYRPF